MPNLELADLIIAGTDIRSNHTFASRAVDTVFLNLDTTHPAGTIFSINSAHLYALFANVPTHDDASFNHAAHHLPTMLGIFALSKTAASGSLFAEINSCVASIPPKPVRRSGHISDRHTGSRNAFHF